MPVDGPARTMFVALHTLPKMCSNAVATAVAELDREEQRNQKIEPPYPATMSVAEEHAMLNQRLTVAVEQRTKTQQLIRIRQTELEHLFTRATKRISKSTRAELDQKIDDLERARTINSLDLKDEREILKHISRIKKEQRELAAWQAKEKHIKELKSHVAELKSSLQRLNTIISEARVRLGVLATAKRLNCSVEQLLGMKVTCPPEQLGRVIGKKGSHVKQLMEKLNVVVDVNTRHNRKDGRGASSVHVVGALNALEATADDLHKVISTKTETIVLSDLLFQYLHAKGIHAAEEIQARHPDVDAILLRNSKHEMRLRGVAEDIVSYQEDLQSFTVIQKDLSMPDRDAAAVVGRKGSQVSVLVQEHQVVIHVERSAGAGSKAAAAAVDANNATKDADVPATVSIIGPVTNVDAAKDNIETLVNQQREGTEMMRVSALIKAALILKSGVGVKQLARAASKAIEGREAGGVLVHFVGADLAIKAKNVVLPIAVDAVRAWVQKLEELSVRIDADPAFMPVFIGKGGKTVKDFVGRHSNVACEFDRKKGLIELAGLDAAALATAADDVRSLIGAHHIDRLTISSAGQLIDIRRSKYMSEISKLAYVGFDDDSQSVLVIRGVPENVFKAKALISQCIAESFVDKIALTDTDLSLLLRNGKKSKLMALESEHNVKLTTKDGVIDAKGDAEHVASALTAIKRFTYGDEQCSVKRFDLSTEQVGIVVGRGGKAKSEIETKHRGVEFSVMKRGKSAVATIRGVPADVDACFRDVMKLLITASVVRNLAVPAAAVDMAVKAAGRIGKLANVYVVAKKEKITFRGTEGDVEYAVGLIDHLISGEKTYVRKIRLSSDDAKKLQSASQNAALQRIGLQTKCKLDTDAESGTVVVKGHQEAVVLAIVELYKMMHFALSPCFATFDIPSGMRPAACKAEFLADLAVSSGASASYDRDVHRIVLRGSSGEMVENALQVLQAKAKESDDLVAVIGLDGSDSWIALQIIGKAGKRIAGLRKSLKCKIEVETSNPKITISADDAVTVEEGRRTLQEIVDAVRKEQVVIKIPNSDLAAFIGRSGSHVKEFRSKHEDVEVEIDRRDGLLRLRSKNEESLAKAKSAVEEWAVHRQALRAEQQANEIMTVHRNQTATIIGPKGATVTAIEKECGCRIKVEREGTVLISGGSPKKRALAKDKVLAVLNAADTVEETNEAHKGKNADVVSEAKVEPSQAANFAPRNPSGSTWSKGLGKPPLSPPKASDFPALESGKDDANVSVDTADESTTTQGTEEGPTKNGISWANIVNLHPPGNGAKQMLHEIAEIGRVESNHQARRDFSRMVTESEWDATSVNSEDDDELGGGGIIADDDSMRAELRDLNRAESDLRKALSVATAASSSCSLSGSEGPLGP